MTPRRKSPPKIDPRYACFRLRVAHSPIHRSGVFAAEPIPAGKRVIEYTGERISPQERSRRLRKPGRPKRILTAFLNSRTVIDAIAGGSGAEYINHSCEPNLSVRKTAGRILLYSGRRIRKDEELTVDYGISPRARKYRCHCGSQKCRGTLNRTKG